MERRRPRLPRRRGTFERQPHARHQGRFRRPRSDQGGRAGLQNSRRAGDRSNGGRGARRFVAGQLPRSHGRACALIDVELASQPEYKRLRLLAKQTAQNNQPALHVVREGKSPQIGDWRELLGYIKNEGTREVHVQRYKGLGEMNAEQLWDTTMNAETRTLLRVSLEDLTECGQDLHDTDGRGRGESPQVHRRERARRSQPRRISERIFAFATLSDVHPPHPRVYSAQHAV